MQTSDLIAVKLKSIFPSDYDQRIPDTLLNSLFTDDLPLSHVLNDMPEVLSSEAPDSDRLWQYAFYTRLFVQRALEELGSLDSECILLFSQNVFAACKVENLLKATFEELL